ncbi:GNAT family N-acetyltransferase [Maricaulis maris]|uniref:GNAT family N-acetyltransferase n=1 Tax=Maricaulis maris TaxID=74318 RepID=UPI0029220326|nr:N-acetyltransferase GCN5 [Maricaulis maris]
MTGLVERVWPTGAGDLAQLHARCFEAAWSSGEIASLLNLPGCSGWACRSGTEIIAMALFRSAADEAELLTLATSPDHRRLGLADKVLTTAEKALSSQGVARIFLEVSARNSGAQALYLRAGYGEIGRRRAYYRDGSDALVLEKWLHKDGQMTP